MEPLRRGRRPVRHLFNKLADDLDEALRVEPLDKDNVQGRFRLFEDCYESLWRHDRRIMEELTVNQLEEDVENTEYEEMQDFRTRAMFLKQRFEKVVQQNQSASLSTESISGQNSADGKTRNFKLRPVEVEKFSGKLTEWLTFWGQFRKIDEDQTMDGSDKFWYLLQALEPNTEAHTLVKAYPPCSENYTKVIKSLKARYADEDLLLQVYVREILSIVTSKQKLTLEDLHTKLEANIFALRTLNLEKADPEMWLYLMAESAMPEGILLNWHRATTSTTTSGSGVENNQTASRLDKLMEFLGKERDARRKTNFSKHFSDGVTKSPMSAKEPKKPWMKQRMSTVGGFHAGEVTPCLFCKRTNHNSWDCLVAKKMTYQQKTDILKPKKRCYRCFEPHFADQCKTPNLSCQICHRRHYTIMCPGVKLNEVISSPPPRKRARVAESGTQTISYINQMCTTAVALQTAIVELRADGRKKTVRVFLDCGSQRSYLRKTTIQELELQPLTKENVIHTVFGGTKKRISHLIYNVSIQRPDGGFNLNMRVRDQDKLCNNIPRVAAFFPELQNELDKQGIYLSDVGNENPLPEIEMIIGADYYGYLTTGRQQILKCGVVAIETVFGWTLMGETKKTTPKSQTAALTYLDMAVTDASVAELWNLETLGIRDPVEIKTEDCLNEEAKQRCFQTMRRTPNGRYCVRLPWKENHPVLPNNLEFARGHVSKTRDKLSKVDMLEKYEKLFLEWEAEGFIERVRDFTKAGHYLPHRAVLKPSSQTTPVRPVFNASFRKGNLPSLNMCLYKGVNLIQKIPDMLLRFREKKVAFVSDIRKAFQMIEVAEEDRDAMRFLWINSRGEEIHYRHCRVMFGATCSPFLLGAVLEHFLSSIDDQRKNVAQKLLRSLYVDNCVCSVDTEEEYQDFKNVSIQLLEEIKMDLRLWFSNTDYDNGEQKIISVLGLLWDRESDEVFVKTDHLEEPETVTKKGVLSVIQKIYDPLGIVCPAVLPMKLLLQRTCINKLKWNDKLPAEDEKCFKGWIVDAKQLNQIKLPRCFTTEENIITRSLHIFTDSSQFAYGAIVFVRNQYEDHVDVHMLPAKARVAPIQKITIPRLELLSTLIGARLSNSVQTALQWEDTEKVYWSDSTTALAWIRRNDHWGTFVGNRTEEVRKLTRKTEWRHVPGKLNPADLPSRGCSVANLIRSKWWMGPAWLKQDEDDWPKTEPDVSEIEVAKELKKTTTVINTFSDLVLNQFSRQYSFASTVRIMGWVKRFLHNKFRKEHEESKSGPLVAEELENAEIALVRKIQSECFPPAERGNLKGLEIFLHQSGTLRVKTRLTNRKDHEEFKFPFVVSAKHPIIRQLIQDVHEECKHAGVGYLVSKLREKYWIIDARKSVRGVINNCVRCRRFSAKAQITPCPPLPEDRVKDAAVFQCTGVDLFGPLFLKGGKKIWITIFTCAVYRAVHFETVNSPSTAAFLNSLKRFIDRFRRPDTIYCDNGSNFHGAENLLKKLNWKYLTSIEETKPILFKFSPPISAWWGGWWERLIRTAKDLMRKSLGKATLSKKELECLLMEVANVMNGRPLTYVSEDPNDLETLTPSHFLDILGRSTFPELQMQEAEKLRFRWNYVKTLEGELKRRFRSEYLALLVSNNPKKSTGGVKVGDIVFVGDDKTKRINWPLAKVLQLIPGKDGISRVAKVKTSNGEFIRTVQRLYPLEAEREFSAPEKMVVTRSGRVVKAPERWGV